MSRKNKKKSPFVPEIKSEIKDLPENFQMKYNLHRPWADVLFETTLPPMILEKMIGISDKVLADSTRIPWGKNLAGQIKEEMLIEPKVLNESNLTDFFGNMVLEYVFLHLPYFDYILVESFVNYIDEHTQEPYYQKSLLNWLLLILQEVLKVLL